METFAEYLAHIDNPQNKGEWKKLEKMIQFNILDKDECSTFWRK